MAATYRTVWCAAEQWCSNTEGLPGVYLGSAWTEISVFASGVVWGGGACDVQRSRVQDRATLKDFQVCVCVGGGGGLGVGGWQCVVCS